MLGLDDGLKTNVGEVRVCEDVHDTPRLVLNITEVAGADCLANRRVRAVSAVHILCCDSASYPFVVWASTNQTNLNRVLVFVLELKASEGPTPVWN